MRAVTSLGKLSAIAVLLSACSGSGPETPEPAPESPPDDTTSATASKAAPAGSSDTSSATPQAKPINVSGTVVDYWTTAVANVDVVVFDAKGMKRTATVDASGRFSIASVSAPYDLAVVPPGGDLSTALVFVGLSRSSVSIPYYGPGATTRVQNRANVTATITLPSCTQGCVIQMVTTSKGGGAGGSMMSYAGSAPSIALTTEHDWLTAPGAPTSLGNVGVDVLVSNAAFTSFWYVHTGIGTLQPNAPANVGVVAPQTAGIFGPVTFATKAVGVPTDWDKDLQAFVRVPEAARPFYMQRVASDNVVTFLPNVPGATYSFGAWRMGNVVDASGNTVVRRNSYASSDEFPLADRAAVISLDKGPDAVAPTENGTLSRSSAPGFKWQPTPGHVAHVDVYDVNQKTARGAFVMTGTELRFDYLAKLGISFQTGPYRFEIYTKPGTSTDDLVDPAKVAQGPATTGAADGTNYSFPFQMVP